MVKEYDELKISNTKNMQFVSLLITSLGGIFLKVLQGYKRSVKSKKVGLFQIKNTNVRVYFKKF